MPYRLSTLVRAERDVEAIAAWLFKRSPMGAIRWIIAYDSIKSKLVENPLAYGLAPEDGRFDSELRQILFKTPHGKRYRAVFTIVGDEVRILRVRRPHQRLLRRKDISEE